MFYRSILVELEKWATKPKRKPLVLRGARQVGKTTIVHHFAAGFKQYIYLNLELKQDKEPFEQFNNMEDLVSALFFIKNKRYQPEKKTLIFIDEIQESAEAFQALRYFYEQAPHIHVIAAGSLLETIFNQQLNFPVGRVEFLLIRPVSFIEFLKASGEEEACQAMLQIPLPEFAHDKLLKLFHTYAIIGGMPEVVNTYVTTKDFKALSSVYEGLISTYLDDVEKYAGSSMQIPLIRHAIRASYTEAGKRIKFQGFGKSAYGSKEMGAALRILEKALLLTLIYPNTGTTLPLIPELQKSPRLQLLDSGMMNYFLGVQSQLLGTTDLCTVYQGTIIEHLVGQELLAMQFNALSTLNFWVREKKTSSAEVDYLFVFEGKLIPIEVKSGKEGKLKSLHLFMNEAPHKLAVRCYAGRLSISTVTTQEEKTYYLLNLPYYLIGQLESYIKWFQQKTEQ